MCAAPLGFCLDFCGAQLPVDNGVQLPVRARRKINQRKRWSGKKESGGGGRGDPRQHAAITTRPEATASPSNDSQVILWINSFACLFAF